MNKKEQRQRRLTVLLEENATMRVGELADALAVTAETVRRDLDELARGGLVSRTYGGAVAVRAAREPRLSERHALLIDERQAIARTAVSRLAGSDVMMIGSGATTTQLARRIAVELTDITVITHSFGVATVLSLNPTITVLMVPGRYHADEGATLGSQALRFLEGYFADWAIVGASGLTEDGAGEALIEAGEVYAGMMRRAGKTMIVADHSKYGMRFPARFARWEQIDCLVTDTAPEASLRTAIERGCTRVEVAGG